MTWMLQAAVVLAVPLSLFGAVRGGAHLVEKAKKNRRPSAGTAVDLYAEEQLNLGGFRGWLADRLEGWSSDGGDGGGGGGDASDASFDGSDD